MTTPAFTINVLPNEIRITAHKTWTIQANHLEYVPQDLAKAITQMAADRLYAELQLALDESKFIYGPVEGSA